MVKLMRGLQKKRFLYNTCSFRKEHVVTKYTSTSDDLKIGKLPASKNDGFDIINPTNLIAYMS